ncbi:MAG: glycosyltransferase family 87 protein [Silvibacterium sp.]
MNGSDEPVELESDKELWRNRVLNPSAGLNESKLICWALFAVALLFSSCVVYCIPASVSTDSSRHPHYDFVYFYGIGQIASRYPSDRIYDLHLQQQTFNTLAPIREGGYGPSPYPPFVALFFTPFAHLSIKSAYFLWMAISLSLYLVGVIATTRATFRDNWLALPLIMAFAVSFYPFIVSTLTSGQLASVAVCAVGLSLYQEEHGNPFRSGLALAVLAYKPTLLLLLLPMLLLTRRFRTLVGFAAGAVAIVLATTALAGIHVWAAYADMSRYFAHTTASILLRWQYVDLHSSFVAVSGGGFRIGIALLICIIGASAIGLACLLWKSTTRNRSTQWLAWASTLTWTLLLNVYTPIYDSALIALAIILTLGALRHLGWSIASRWTKVMALIIFTVSWITESFARNHGIQLLTLMLLVFGVAQLLLLYRAIREKSPEIAAREI